MTVDEIRPLLRGWKNGSRPKQYKALCPAHDDHNPSLSITETENGHVLVRCWTGCSQTDIARALNVSENDLKPSIAAKKGKFQTNFTTKRKNKTKPKEDHGKLLRTDFYKYTDIDGNFIRTKRIKRFEDKTKDTIWLNDKKGDPANYLYNLPCVKSADTIFLVEGEKDVETLKACGRAAVSVPHGADTEWKDVHTEYLKGKNVIVIQDNDEPGKKLAIRECNALTGHAASVKLVDLSQLWQDIPEHGDITDYCQTQNNHNPIIKSVETMVAGLPEYQKQEPPADVFGRAEYTEPQEPKKLSIISAADLYKADLPPVKFIVKDILPEGTGMVSAPSKTGKSWLVLDMGLSVSAGIPFMGYPTNQCGVLYLALEDSLARLQDRMKKVLNGSPAPEQFYFAIKAPTIDDGLLDLFDLHFKEHPETKLVIIDTLQKVRGQSLPRESSYAQDYREMGIIKNFMDARGVTVFFVHHNRKMIDESDPFNMISGTTAIMGAADTIMIMTKDKRADQTATLHLTGRDIPQSSIVVKFDKDCWKWYPLGESDWVEAQRARKEYTDSPIVKTIKKLIEQNPKKRWDGSAKDLLNAGKLIAKTYIAATPAKVGYEVKKLDQPLFDYDGILHTTTTHGTAGKVHHFYYANMGSGDDVLEEFDPQEKIF